MLQQFSGSCDSLISCSSSENIFLLQPLAQNFIIHKEKNGDEGLFSSDIKSVPLSVSIP